MTGFSVKPVDFCFVLPGLAGGVGLYLGLRELGIMEDASWVNLPLFLFVIFFPQIKSKFGWNREATLFIECLAVGFLIGLWIPFFELMNERTVEVAP